VVNDKHAETQQSSDVEDDCERSKVDESDDGSAYDEFDDDQPDLVATDDDDEEECEGGSEGEEDDDDNDFDEDEDRVTNEPTESEGFVDLHISNYALRETAATDAEETQGEIENEAEDYLDNICILTDYWYRPPSMIIFNYAFVREHFHLVRNKPPESSGLRMQLGHPNPDKGYWLRNEHQRRRCLIFVGGKVKSYIYFHFYMMINY